MSGYDLEEQMAFIAHQSIYPNLELYRSAIIDLEMEMIHNSMKLESLRDIARILIRNSADSNAEHTPPIKGCTPLMLAAEIDEVDVFKLMVASDGDLSKTYKHIESN